MDRKTDKTKTSLPRNKRRCGKQAPPGSTLVTEAPVPMPAAFDPELLYMECAKCGSPVIWEPGRISSLLEKAGIDPMELDSACILMTDSCAACGQADEYSIRIFRLTDRMDAAPVCGHA